MDEESATAEISRYMLAINDMGDVSHVARLIADHDPNFNPLGPEVVKPPGLHAKQAAAFRRKAADLHGALGNMTLRSVLETGLIVTYARPFAGGGGIRDPERFVPTDRQGFHEKMRDLRNKVQAHSTASAPEGFRRTIQHSEQPGSWSIQSSRPRYLKAGELRQLADLADEITQRLTVARDKARETMA